MNETLQDLAWAVLPKEFKEEVKEDYNYALLNKEYTKQQILENLFGEHNLTSDAEGEDELLMYKRKDIQYYYQYHKAKSEANLSAEQQAYYKGRVDELLDLFGSKCLLNETKDETKEPNPSEPKYHVGQKVKFKDKDFGFEITAIEKRDDCDEYQYKLAGWKLLFRESQLEPYTEPTDLDKESSTCTNECPSQCPSQDFENIIKDGFRGHNRLHIAAMAMQGLLANSHQELVDMKIEQVVQLSLEMADALIKESEKKGDR